MRLIVYLTFGMFMSIGSIMIADNKDSINSTCEKDKTMTYDQCIKEVNQGKPLIIAVFFIGGMIFVIFICEFFGTFNVSSSNRIFLDITKCSQCGESFISGTVWCGNEGCKEKWREKYYV